MPHTLRQYPVGQDKTGTTGQGKPLGFKTHIKPSTAAQHRHLLQMKGELRKLRAASHEGLIGTLNPLIQGWSHDDSAVVAKATLSRMDTLVYATLRRWAHRRHPKKSSWWVSEQYWHLREGHWTFKTDRGKTLRRHADTPIRRHTKVTGARSPYDGDGIDWATRMGKHPETSKRWAYLLKRQQGRCFWCRLYFNHGDDLGALDHIQPRSQGLQSLRSRFAWAAVIQPCHGIPFHTARPFGSSNFDGYAVVPTNGVLEPASLRDSISAAMSRLKWLRAIAPTPAAQSKYRATLDWLASIQREWEGVARRQEQWGTQ